jgi:hypothetical protein
MCAMNSEENKTKDKAGIGFAKIARALIIFGIGLFLMLNKYSIYRFIDDLLITSPAEWNGYKISYGKDFRIAIINEKDFMLVTKQDDAGLLDMFMHDSDLVPPHRSLESFCQLNSCYDIKSEPLKINNSTVEAYKANFNKNDDVRFIFFTSLPDTNVEIKIEGSESHYEDMRSIINKIQKSSDVVK